MLSQPIAVENPVINNKGETDSFWSKSINVALRLL